MAFTWPIIETIIELAGSDVRLTLVFSVIVLVIFKVAEIIYRDRKLPPGPWGVPFLGFLPFVKVPAHLLFTDLSKRYGPTFSFRFGQQLIVVLSNYKTISAAFRSEAFSGRPENEISQIIEGFGLINVDGKLWKGQRKFLHEQLRSFGMKTSGLGREQLEGRIMTEVDEFLSAILASRGQPVNLCNYLTVSISNVICSLLMSVRFSCDDARFKNFTELIEEGFRLCTSTGSTNFIPCLKYLPDIKEINVKIAMNRAEMAGFFREIVEEHKRSFDGSNLRDVVDGYLLEIDTAKIEERQDHLFEGKDHDRQIYQILGDMYSAGMETVKTAMNWAVLYMLHYPEVLNKVQNELDEVVGRERLPTLDDLESLPYTQATLFEVLRRACVVPLGTTHCTTTDVVLDGYKIPKNTQVIPLIYAVLMDEELWEDPKEFNPSRFLDEDGKLTKIDYWIPFGVGRRKCLGDILAKHELFLFFTSLVHCFHLRKVEGTTLPNLIGQAAVTICPDDYELVAIPRREDGEHQHTHKKEDENENEIDTQMMTATLMSIRCYNMLVTDRRNADAWTPGQEISNSQL